MKKFLTTILSVAIAATAAFQFAGCTTADNGSSGSGSGNSSGSSGSTPGGDPVSKTACVNMDINPSLELITDESGTVVAVRGVNDDGCTIIYDENGIKGETIENAVKKITELAIQTGYLNQDNSVVGTTINATDEEFLNSIKERVNSTVTATAQNSGLSVTTTAEEAYSLIRQMEQLQADFPNNKAIQSLTISKFRLALSVSETGEISLEAAAELDDSQLLAMLKEADEKIEAYATEEFLAKKAQALAIYDRVATVKTYQAYTEIYSSHATAHFTTAYYGAGYQLYASAATGFSSITAAENIKNEVKNFEISESKAAAIAEALGITDLTALKNADGKITVKSVEAYADKLFKNSPASEALEIKKQNLTAALNAAEAEIKPEIDKLSDEMKTQINAQLTQADATYQAVKTTLDALKAAISAFPTVAADIEQLTSDYETITAEIRAYLNEENASVSGFEALAKEYREKADFYFDRIEKDLSASEKAEVQAKIETILASCESEKTALENAINQAAEAAKTSLAQAKKALTEKNAD